MSGRLPGPGVGLQDLTPAPDVMPSDAYVRQIGEARPLHTACKKLGAKDPAAIASALEFVLEGLHLSRKLNKDMKAGQTSYRG